MTLVDREKDETEIAVLTRPFVKKKDRKKEKKNRTMVFFVTVDVGVLTCLRTRHAP